MTIHIRQSAQKASEKHWNWRVWLEGPAAELGKIDSVTYQLHSTFKNPLRQSRDRASGFMIKSSGWGQFMIYLTIHRSDGSTEKSSGLSMKIVVSRITAASAMLAEISTSISAGGIGTTTIPISPMHRIGTSSPRYLASRCTHAGSFGMAAVLAIY